MDTKALTITTRKYQIYGTTVSLFVFLHHTPFIEKMVSELNLEKDSIENIFKKYWVETLENEISVGFSKTNVTKDRYDFVYEKNPHLNRFNMVLERLVDYGIKNRFKTHNMDFKNLEI